jgi:hypothetical protein
LTAIQTDSSIVVPAPERALSGWRVPIAAIGVAGTIVVPLLVSAPGLLPDTFFYFGLSMLVRVVVLFALLFAIVGGRPAPWRVLCGVLVAVYFTVVFLAAAYVAFTEVPFELAYSEFAASDSFLTAIKSMAETGAILLLVALSAYSVMVATSWVKAFGAASWTPRVALRVGLLSALCLVVLPEPLAKIVLRPDENRIVKEEVKRIAPLYSVSALASDEPFFFLQLESVNSLAVNGFINHQRTWIPEHLKIAQEGIYFPFFVGSSMNTSRAQETLFCGITRNGGREIAYAPWTLPHPCLPQLLRRAGYTTVFLSDLPNPNFLNTAEMAREVGFTDVHFADFMHGDEASTPWGYAGEAFFQRAFDYLHRRYPNPRKLFVYIATSAEHFPFVTTGVAPASLPFPVPADFRQRYLDAEVAQDRAEGFFYQHWSEYTGGESHLMIAGDHSYPVGLHDRPHNSRGATTDNLLTTFLYVPPKSMRADFRVGATVSAIRGQKDVVPTILDLLGAGAQRNSLAGDLMVHAVRQTDPCETFIQPFSGGDVSIVAGWNHYMYSFRQRTATAYRIDSDPLENHPRLIGSMSWGEFRRRYDCMP